MILQTEEQGGKVRYVKKKGRQKRGRTEDKKGEKQQKDKKDVGNGKERGNGKVREQVRNVIVRKGKWKYERKLRLRKGEKEKEKWNNRN